MKPLFSIIIVVYNGASTIRKALTSLAAQTFRQFEVVIIDGGSTDDTMHIVAEFKDIIGFSVSEPDKGIYDAMNKGIDHTTGQWLYFLGSDDALYSDTVLEQVASEVGHRDCNFFYGDVMIVPEKFNYGGAFDFERLTRNNISHQAIFYHKTLIHQIGYYNLNHKIYADWEYNLRCFSSPYINSKYSNLFIANFSSTGASGAHDVVFLKLVLIPQKAIALEFQPGLLSKIKVYDSWWRMLRNAEIRSLDDLDLTLPKSVQTMIQQQRKVSPQWLKNGVLSKSYMFISYLLYRLS